LPQINNLSAAVELFENFTVAGCMQLQKGKIAMLINYGFQRRKNLKGTFI
jgi:hypothetical protein